jgi:hypothetical protein
MSNYVTKIFHKIWGGFAIPHKPIRFRWIDFLLVLGIAGLFYGPLWRALCLQRRYRIHHF